MAVGQTLPATCFWVGHELRIVITFLKDHKKTNKDKYATEALCRPQSLKYSLSDLLQKTFATFTAVLGCKIDQGRNFH